MYRAMVAFCLVFIFSGCATTAKYEAKLNSWVGASESALVSSWGVPDKVYAMNDGKKAVAYIHKDTVQSGGYSYVVPQTTYQTGTIGNQTYSGTATTYVTETEPVHKYRLFCKTSFIISHNGTIESWHHEGNNCVAQ